MKLPALRAMIRKSSSKVGSFIAHIIYRHSVSLIYSPDAYRDVYDWVQTNVSKRGVWVNFNTTTWINAQGVITQTIDDNRLEFRFVRVRDAVLFKLTFCDLLHS
jgi:hypothetical protein